MLNMRQTIFIVTYRNVIATGKTSQARNTLLLLTFFKAYRFFETNEKHST